MSFGLSDGGASGGLSAVSEGDNRMLRRLDCAEALCKARKMWTRGDAGKIAAAVVVYSRK